VEKKIRRHMLRARKRQGFGWTRWSRDWLYETLGLFNGYRAVRLALKVRCSCCDGDLPLFSSMFYVKLA
jgi:hypothetical protein